jgi:hypothetical protein
MPAFLYAVPTDSNNLALYLRGRKTKDLLNLPTKVTPEQAKIKIDIACIGLVRV